MYDIQQVKPQIRVTHIELIETKRYKPMNIRPYEVHANYNDLNNLRDVVTNTMARGITNKDMIETYMNKSNPNILMPSAQILTEVPIVNGWNEKRFHLTLTLEIKHHGSNVITINHIQGYTEYMGISHMQTLDDTMQIFINSINVLRKSLDPQSGAVNVTPLGVYSVAYDETSNMMNNTLNEYKVSRPDDIVSKISSLKEVRANTAFVSNLGSLNDVQIIDKDVTTPMGHISSTVSSVLDNTMINGIMGSDSDIYDTVTGDLLSLTPEHIDFYKLLYGIKGQIIKSFTLGDISLLDGNHPAPIVHIGEDIAKMKTNPAFVTDDGAYTNDSSYETRMSLVIQDTVSHILSLSILDELVFSINNKIGQPLHMISSISSIIENLNLTLHGEMFVKIFLNKAWPIISNNNKSLVELEVFCYGTDMTIKLSLDNRPEIIYVYPTFADAKYMPIIMDDNSQDRMAEGYGEIIDTVMQTAKEVVRNNTMSAHQHFGM